MSEASNKGGKARVDILCITAHPDDAEISCAGTLLKHKAQGRAFGLVELTCGELGTRGNATIRKKEAEEAGKILGASFRYQLDLADGFFRKDEASLLKIIDVIRSHRPKVLITNALMDRHPDHGRGAELVAEATFLSGLKKIEREEEAWRPTSVLHCIQDRWMKPDLVVGVTEYWPKKQEALRAFSSQFHDPNSNEPDTPISSKDFWHFLEGRAREMGRLIGVTYGEGFVCSRPPGVGDLTELS